MAEETQTPPAVALGISVVTNMPGDRGITVQTHVALDVPLEEQDRIIDRMFRLVDRQKARYELPDVEDELALHQKTLARMEEDLKGVDHEHNVAQARRRAELKALSRELDEAEETAKRAHESTLSHMARTLEEYTAKREAEFAAGYDEFTKGGRQGSYEPTGHRRVNLDRMDKQIADFKAQIAEKRDAKDRAVAVETAPISKMIGDKQAELDKATSERLQHQQTTEISKRRYREEILLRERKIAKLKARLAGSGPEEG